MSAETQDTAANAQEQLREMDFETSAINMMTEAGISLKNVTKRYGKVAVVDDIDLVIEPGEFMTLLGPSGSGKTTTLNMIAGFADVTEGLLHIYGKPVAKLPAHKRDIGMVFQNYALFPHKTVAQNIAFPLERRKIAKDVQKTMITEALDMVKMTEFGDRYPSELSGGQQQRVALARALVYKPRVLLMDEPLGALDKKLREWLQAEIKRIHKEVGSTFVYVTHDQDEALSMSDRIAVFNNGKIEQVGSAIELYERPATLFVGKFLGESTVFFGRGTKTSDGNTTVDCAGSRILAHGHKDAENCAVLVRPENISLQPADYKNTDASENAVPGNVETATYLGSAWRYEVKLADGNFGTIRMPHDAPIFEEDSPVMLTWPVASGVLLEDLGEADESLT
jgi:putative spermidine/putrescine transport system ATP-binding protein